MAALGTVVEYYSSRTDWLVRLAPV